jgi:HlyD family secretion protein
MNKLIKFLIPGCICVIAACSGEQHTFDAAGSFEATEIIVSSEANGKILSFKVTEGDEVNKGDTIAIVDVNYLKLQRDQVEAKLNAIRSKTGDADPGVQILKKQLVAANAKTEAAETQLEVIKKEEKRIANLFAKEAATAQQMDEISGKVSVLEKELDAARKQTDVLNTQMQSTIRTVAIQNRAILSELEPTEIQLKIIDDQIEKAIITSPINGSIINKYAEPGEMAALGKPLVKIADLTKMELKAFVTGDQLPMISPGQDIRVFLDKNKDTFREYAGKVSWISDKAEFTPKSIQTKDERANLVYPVKILVQNDGEIKIGMYGEISLTSQQSENE